MVDLTSDYLFERYRPSHGTYMGRS